MTEATRSFDLGRLLPRRFTEAELADRRELAEWFMNALDRARRRGVDTITLPVVKRPMTDKERLDHGVRKGGQ